MSAKPGLTTVPRSSQFGFPICDCGRYAVKGGDRLISKPLVDTAHELRSVSLSIYPATYTRTHTHTRTRVCVIASIL